MKRAVIISAISIIMLLASAFFLISRLSTNTLDNATESMMKRANSLSITIETSFSAFLDESEYFFNDTDYRELLVTADKSTDIFRNLKKFCFKHQDMIEELSISDGTSERKILLTGHNQIDLLPLEKTTSTLELNKAWSFKGDKAEYVIPLLDKNGMEVYANLTFVLNVTNLAHHIIEQDNVDKSIWILFGNDSGILTTQTYNPVYTDIDSVSIDNLASIQAEIYKGLPGAGIGNVTTQNKKIHLVYAYNPVVLLNQNYCLIYGKDKTSILNVINYVTITLSIIFAVILLIAIWTFLHFIKRLRIGEERLLRIQTAVNNASDLIIITDMQKNTLFVNQTYTDIFGSDTLAMTNPVSLVITDSDIRNDIDEMLNNNKSYMCELEIRNKYEEHTTCLLRANIIHDNEKRPLGIMYMATDIAERKKAERMKNEFISTVSHELRTPLTSIRGSLGLIRGGVTGELSSQAQKLVDIAYTNSERLVRLINDILDIEKIEAGKMEFHLQPLELLPLVEKSVEMMRNFANQYNVNIKLTKSLPDVKSNIDADRFEQVMVNLISNAAKFSPSGSTIEIEMAVASSGVIRVSVIDHGIGIPEEFKSMLFKKFAQVDSSDSKAKGGTGLGLSISKAIIEKFGGNIGCETTEKVGSIFFVELTEATIVADAESFVDSNVPKILIVEDDADIAALLKMILEDAGYAAAIAYSAEDAKIKLNSTDFAAMTLDLLLPQEQGIQLVRELREDDKTAHLPIIVVSAVADQQKQQFRGSFDIVDWIQKPIDLARLRRVLQETIYPMGNEKFTILHVEDDKDNTIIVAQILKDKANIVLAQSLKEAISKVKNERFDLVILDITLPDGNGMELLSHLRNCGKQSIPVLIFSASETSNDIQKKVAASLVKSKTNNAELIDMIQSIIGKQQTDKYYTQTKET